MHGDGGRTVLSFSEDILKAETLSSFIVNTHPIAAENSTMRCPSSRECQSDSVQGDVSLESKWVQMCLFFHFKLMRKSEIYMSFLFSFHYLCVSALNPRDLPSAQRLVCWGKPVLPILYRTFFLQRETISLWGCQSSKFHQQKTCSKTFKMKAFVVQKHELHLQEKKKTLAT